MQIRQHFNSKARALHGEKRKQHAEDVEDLMAQVQVERLRGEQEAQISTPWRLPDCAWQAKDFELFQAAVASGDFTEEKIASLRARAVEVPQPPSAEQLRSLAEFEDQRVFKPPTSPPWVRQLCQRRTNFNKVALRWSVGDETHVVKFLFARLQPRCYFICGRLNDVGISMPYLEDFDWHKVVGDAPARHRFCHDWGSYVDSDELAQLDEHALEVLPSVSEVLGGFVESAFPWVPLREYMGRFLPDPAAVKQSKQQQHSKGDGLAREFDWIRQSLKEQVATNKKTVAPEDSGSQATAPEHAPLDDDEAEEALSALHMMRHEMNLEGLSTWDEFKIDPLGGPAMLRKRGTATPGILAHPRSELAKEFVRLNGIRPQTVTLSFDVYTQPIAHILGRAWCHRLQYFYDQALATQDFAGPFTATAMVKAAYIEPTEFSELARTQVPAKVRQRIVLIRSIFA